ncbi:sulfatase [Frankia sp. BMG5.23]|uniref:sulfatase family protein n=1 Tax=Frankia sp. BMG5.23 TaxID=683305 RepID=UPI000460F873|nr:sulfatase [Frankia sp. BMG5.23]KDA41167.1 arylsulfatase A family protein [Frankia sp. BMG5.23]
MKLWRREHHDSASRRRPRSRRRLVAATATATASLALAAGACGGSAAPATTASAARPNIVFILTDDLSWNLVTDQIAPHITALERQGETFDHYFVTDSLCCPSRSSIFTGLLPHDTKVETNLSPDGGYGKFQQEGLAGRTFAVALQAAGYQTSMLGKYLNGYGDPTITPTTGPVPRGWSDWHVSNTTGYAELNFDQNDNGVVRHYAGQDNYGVDVLNADAQAFIRRSAGKPFALEVATYAPHQPYTPAPRNADDFPGLTEPRDPSFNTNNTDAPAWLGQRAPLAPSVLTNLDQAYRERAQAVESVDKLVGDTEATLAAEHLLDNTYFVFSSDNGYHLGQHRLVRGKQTAFDTDIRVPLIVTGPGVPHGRVISQVAQNVDLYPTFTDLAGATPARPVDGRSLVPLLRPATEPPSWRTIALVEHLGQASDPADPDHEPGGSNPTTYEAIRISAPHLAHFDGPVEAVYVEYNDSKHEIEYYDITKDPYEINNVAGALTGAQRAELHTVLAGLGNCHTQAACAAAGLPI